MRNDSSHTEASVIGWLEDLVEQTWRETDGATPRERIREMALEAALRYSGDAKITAYIPMLVRRNVRERLRRDAR